MKNTRKMFGTPTENIWEVFEPIKVIKIGFAYDRYKKKILDQLWEDAYCRIKMQMPLLNPEEEFFWSETTNFNGDGSVLLENRFFTPKENRVRLK